MSRITNTKKHLNKIPCDCRVCINTNRHNHCRFGWVPENGMCKRFSKNDYILTKEEKAQVREQTLLNQQKRKEEMRLRKTSFAFLSEALEFNLTPEQIKSCLHTTYLGNGKVGIQCINPEELIISVKYKSGKTARYKIIK